MVMKLVWHPFALDDLAQIVKYCHHNFGIVDVSPNLFGQK